jgi:hypothetical protein
MEPVRRFLATKYQTMKQVTKSSGSSRAWQMRATIGSRQVLEALAEIGSANPPAVVCNVFGFDIGIGKSKGKGKGKSKHDSKSDSERAALKMQSLLEEVECSLAPAISTVDTSFGQDSGRIGYFSILLALGFEQHEVSDAPLPVTPSCSCSPTRCGSAPEGTNAKALVARGGHASARDGNTNASAGADGGPTTPSKVVAKSQICASRLWPMLITVSS